MGKTLAPVTCTLGDVRRNPTKTLRDAGGFVAVMQGDEVAFYLVSPEIVEAWVDRIRTRGACPLELTNGGSD